MPFLKACWYVAAWSHELTGENPVARQVIGMPLVLYRIADGSVSVLEDRCPHRHAALSLGRVEGDLLRCMYHGLLFAADGTCVHVPGSDTVPASCAARAYPVRERDGWIWVWMGDPATADDSLIPQAFGIDDPRWTMRAGQMDYAAHFMLINDNLCDLSHLDFVHERTLGLATGYGWSDDVPRVVALDRGIRVERWFEAKPASPTNPRLVDTWSTYSYWVPGIFVMENRSYLHGMAQACNGAAPTAEPMTYRIEQQAVTPVTGDQTRYFFAAGFDAANLPEKLIEGIFETVMAAFAEDHRMIEAQQRIWDTSLPGTPMTFIPQDKAPAMFRRIYGKLLRAETPVDASGPASA